MNVCTIVLIIRHPSPNGEISLRELRFGQFDEREEARTQNADVMSARTPTAG
jgi:hypothetical protein